MMDGHITLTRLIVSIVILVHGCHSDVKCRNDQGDQVDWYILYKLPNIKDGGLSYFYMDESTNGWKLSKEKINSTSGSLANTLKPLLDFYDKKTEGFGYLLYNDQPPNQKTVSSSYGHSKGVVMLNRQTGVWLSHSTPKFPTYRRKDFWPDSGKTNAQTFICVHFGYDQFKIIGLQLQYIHAYSYDFDLPKTFHEELRCVAHRSCYPRKEPWFSVMKLTSLMKRSFLSFAKHTRYDDDLYSGLIAKWAKGNLFAKSWGKMHQPLPSNCSSSIPHHVNNVKEVELLKGKPFSNTMDHSKWCVTSGGGLICIADMNREKSQMSRGGGAICTDDTVVAKAFIALISQYEPCKQLVY
ncbi:deoxyribonuclease-2-beta-like [Melanotaenia boesemani]|uniref:deoxyribonuclease-2-beta-like n=1 Tax=Melanotaenia boesemani TaxID=1250792 RepID=UPI001C03A7AF|nr:deoxyribonuclease-2-beta-like [Melanotaenia boesemani]